MDSFSVEFCGIYGKKNKAGFREIREICGKDH